MNLSMRKNYDEYGVEGFYQRVAAEYRNPHFEQVRKLTLAGMADIDNIDQQKTYRVLDFACGSGEAGISALEWASKVGKTVTLTPSDPYTKESFNARCQTLFPHEQSVEFKEWSFDDIADGALDENYDLLIVSFALHLLDESKLPAILTQFALKCKYMLIITPHKRPPINENYGFRLLTTRTYMRVHSRLFASTFYSES